MASSIAVLFLNILIFNSITIGHGARILGIFPAPSISHQLPFQAIMKALAARGHQITVISPNPLKLPVQNHTDIDLSKSYEFVLRWNFSEWANTNPIDTMSKINELFTEVLEFQLEHPKVQELIRSNETFDLVLIEAMTYQAYHGLVHRVGSPPLVGVFSAGGTEFLFDAMGNPNHPAYSPDMMVPYTDHMTFWERLYNLYAIMKTRYTWHYEILPRQEKLMRKYFGSDPPSVYESYYNMSLLLLSNHWSLNYPRPLLPNVVELTGLHVQTTPKPLPKNIQNFLDGGRNGVVYFSLGSNVKGKDLPEEILKQILQAFSELPQRVLWKFEADSLVEVPANVMLVKWLPQQDVLAHPNMRVFVTQGGLQSFQEAAYHGVPLIGIPFMGDQAHDVAKFEAAKIGVKLSFSDLTRETLLEALGKVLNDSSFRENMKSFSAVYREQVGPSLERGIWWIEYVLRHKGAPHLRSAALDLTWYQYLLLDVIVVLLLGAIVAIFVSYVVLRKIISLVCKYLPSQKLKVS